MVRESISLALFTIFSSSCAESPQNSATLYRNSPFAYDLRVHWASFDADESDPSYNMNNCMMAARILNANVTASAEAEGKRRDESAGFWCEVGRFRENGSIPTDFVEAFPTDT